MKCPACGTFGEYEVLSTRSYGDQTTDKRRLWCACGWRWTTIEAVQEGTGVLVRRDLDPLPVAAPATRSALPVAGADIPPPPVAAAPNHRPLPVAAAPPQKGTNPLPVAGGGVGGALPSGSDPGLEFGPSSPDLSERAPARESLAPQRPRSPIWTPDDWKRLFGQAWSEKFTSGARFYGAAGDSKACGALGDLIAELPQADVLAAQERAGAMFAEFFADRTREVVKARHCFYFFVQRWGGLRVPAVPSDAEPSRQVANARRLGPVYRKLA